VSAAHAGRAFAALVRVSKVGGREGESFVSPTQQEDRVRAAVASLGGAVEKVVTELDVSGRSTDRDGLNEALEWVYDRAHERGLAVLDISRLGRTLKGTMEVIETLQSLDGAFLSVNEQMNTTTSSGRLAIQNMAAIAEFQSNTISDRWKSVHEDRIGDGLPSGGAARFGYEIERTTDPATGRVKNARVQTPHPTNGPTLAQMYRDFVAGRGALSIARDLNARGVKTERGNPWNIQGVLRTLDCGWGAGYVLVGHYATEVVRDPETDRPVMDGGKPKTRRRRVRTEHVKGRHEAVVSEEEWRRYLATREKRKTKAPRHKHPRWHLAGLAKCGLCGASLSVSSYRDERTLVICTAYKTARTCSGVWMSKAKLDRAVFWWLTSRLDELARNASTGRDRSKQRKKAQAARDSAQATVEKLDLEKVATVRLYAQGDMTDAQYREAKRQNEAETKKARAAFQAAEERLERLAPTEETYEALIAFGKAAGAKPAPTVGGAAPIEEGGAVHHLLPEGNEDEAADALTKEALAVLDSPEYAEQAREAVGDDSPAVYNALLAKVVDRIEVTKEQVEVFPLVGSSHTVPRL
jgi:site-specific DNA recombinase